MCVSGQAWANAAISTSFIALAPLIEGLEWMRLYAQGRQAVCQGICSRLAGCCDRSSYLALGCVSAPTSMSQLSLLSVSAGINVCIQTP